MTPVCVAFRGPVQPCGHAPRFSLHCLSTPRRRQSTLGGRFSDESFCGRDVQFDLPFIGVAAPPPRQEIGQAGNIPGGGPDPAPRIAPVAAQLPREARHRQAALADREQQRAALRIAAVQDGAESARSTCRSKADASIPAASRAPLIARRG